ncbi:ubiquitin-like small modifier protein 1 [Halorussus salinus]|uniref:ubiquitin-like small modifier protein 1 n=1 Tax=Halorussus salinus TaxID=1364935 RepID=UPI001EE491FB|nr:ubiquitin-like small modifier protein 1 [Halorussus salinus]
MTTSAPERITVELTLYATYRESVGQKSLTRDLPADATLADLLADLADEYPDLDGRLTDEGDLRPQVAVLRNGSERADLDTRLEDGDELSVTSPVHGG